MRTRARASAADGGGDGSIAFVTVGTTKFDALVAAVDDPRVGAALAARGFRRLVMQVRRAGAVVPRGSADASRGLGVP